jgi:hypothetical protein
MQQLKLSTSTTVIILKKMQGSVWREQGRTGVCPTPEWLRAGYGEGEYELRLKSGNRVLCMVAVRTDAAKARATGSTTPPLRVAV